MSEKKEGKISLWFKLRSRQKEQIKIMKKIISDQEKQLKIQIDKAVLKIEELDQHKLYYIFVEGASDDDLKNFRMMMRAIKNHLKWTMPNIVIMNRIVEELSLKGMEQLIQQKKDLEKNIKKGGITNAPT